MNRLLYNPRLTAKYFLSFDDLLWLNYLNDNKEKVSYHTLRKYSENISGVDGEGAFFQLSKLELITGEMDDIKLTPKGKEFFAEDTILSPEEYEITTQILRTWNSIPEATTHKVRLQGEPQTKTVFKATQIVKSLLKGKMNILIADAKYHDEPAPLLEEPMILKDIIETIEDYSLKFKDDFYPNAKKNLPKNILDFFMNHQFFTSEFFAVYYDGVLKKKVGTSSQLEEWGITPKTLKKVYDVMLSPENRNSESAKYILMKQLVLLHGQWVVLTGELDKYYLWKKSYRDLTTVFNYFTMDYVDWIGNNITGEKFPMYMQIKEDHEVYSQFRAWYSDKYQIKFKVGVGQREYLLKKTKKYVGEIKWTS
jgi:hypothetical protein